MWKALRFISQPSNCSRSPAGASSQRVGQQQDRHRAACPDSRVQDIFAWGKHLVFQFDTFALRVHFMLWGTFAATVQGQSVTGDYRRSGPAPPRTEFSERRDHDLGCLRQIRRRSGCQGRLRFLGRRHGAMNGMESAAFRKSASLSARRDRRRAARPGHLRRRWQHHQERSAFPDARQPFRKGAATSPTGSCGPSSRTRETSRSGFSSCGESSRCARISRSTGRSACPRCGGKVDAGACMAGARGAAFSARKCQRVRTQRIFQHCRNARSRSGTSTWYRPSTRCTRPDTSSTAARASVNRRVSPASA